MVDRDPIMFWTRGAVTLMGDAAHPMYPRGSNGAAQAILDAESLARWLAREAEPEAALKAYEAERLGAASALVLANRSHTPDTIIREVFERTGDRPFDRIEDVISRQEIEEITGNYSRATGLATGPAKSS